MKQPCPHCDHPDASLLRLVLIGEILRADETLLWRLAEIIQQCGLLQLSDEADTPAATLVRPRKATLHYLQRSGADTQGWHGVRKQGNERARRNKRHTAE